MARKATCMFQQAETQQAEMVSGTAKKVSETVFPFFSIRC